MAMIGVSLLILGEGGLSIKSSMHVSCSNALPPSAMGILLGLQQHHRQTQSA